ncbi:hypothetical protein V8C86DRAFT_2790294 [Haematococcus lacustris]
MPAASPAAITPAAAAAAAASAASRQCQPGDGAEDGAGGLTAALADGPNRRGACSRALLLLLLLLPLLLLQQMESRQGPGGSQVHVCNRCHPGHGRPPPAPLCTYWDCTWPVGACCWGQGSSSKGGGRQQGQGGWAGGRQGYPGQKGDLARHWLRLMMQLLIKVLPPNRDHPLQPPLQPPPQHPLPSQPLPLQGKAASTPLPTASWQPSRPPGPAPPTPAC